MIGRPGTDMMLSGTRRYESSVRARYDLVGTGRGMNMTISGGGPGQTAAAATTKLSFYIIILEFGKNILKYLLYKFYFSERINLEQKWNKQ